MVDSWLAMMFTRTGHGRRPDLIAFCAWCWRLDGREIGIECEASLARWDDTLSTCLYFLCR